MSRPGLCISVVMRSMGRSPETCARRGPDCDGNGRRCGRRVCPIQTGHDRVHRVSRRRRTDCRPDARPGLVLLAARPAAAWPQSLRTVVGLLLQSRFPMFVAWGPELGFLYNDAYADILGAKHPSALGRRFQDIWSEIWTDISPLIDAAMAGQATYREDLPLVMNRKGYDEQTWFTFSYSPVRDESGKVAGMFCAVSETTQKVLAERALRELQRDAGAAGDGGARRAEDPGRHRRGHERVRAGRRSRLSMAGDQRRRGQRVPAHLRRASEGRRQHDRSAGGQPDHQHAVKAVWDRALAGEEFTAIEEFGDPARDRRAYEMRFNTLRDRDGQRIGAYQFVYDVTERLRDQERLRQPKWRCARRRRWNRSASSPAASRTTSTTCSRSLRAACSCSSALAACRPPARVRGHAPRRCPRHRPDPAPAGLFAAPAGQSGVDRRRRHLKACARCSTDRSAATSSVQMHVRARRLAGRGRCRRVGAGDPEPVPERPRRDGRRRRHHHRCRERARGDRDGRAGGLRQDRRSPTPATACRPRFRRGCSSRSSRPRTSARAQASGCRRCTASRNSLRAGSRSRARWASARS